MNCSIPFQIINSDISDEIELFSYVRWVGDLYYGKTVVEFCSKYLNVKKKCDCRHDRQAKFQFCFANIQERKEEWKYRLVLRTIDCICNQNIKFGILSNGMGW